MTRVVFAGVSVGVAPAAASLALAQAVLGLGGVQLASYALAVNALAGMQHAPEQSIAC